MKKNIIIASLLVLAIMGLGIYVRTQTKIQTMTNGEYQLETIIGDSSVLDGIKLEVYEFYSEEEDYELEGWLAAKESSVRGIEDGKVSVQRLINEGKSKQIDYIGYCTDV